MVPAIKKIYRKNRKKIHSDTLLKSSPISGVFIFKITMKQNNNQMEKILLEIRDAEGGTDAKLLVGEM